MKKILSLQTMDEKDNTSLCVAPNISNVSIRCKKQSTISIFMCVNKPNK